MKEIFYRIEQVESGWAVIKEEHNSYNGKVTIEIIYIGNTENQAINMAICLAKITGNKAIIPEKNSDSDNIQGE